MYMDIESSRTDLKAAEVLVSWHCNHALPC